MQFHIMNCLFCCVRLYNRLFYKKVPTERISTSKLPWLFVGVELVDGELLDRTAHAKMLVNFNSPITAETVSSMIHPHLIKRCFYLDSTTLNEEEFPAEGLVIKDDSDE